MLIANPPRLRVEPTFEEGLQGPLNFERRYLLHLVGKPFCSAHEVVQDDILGGIRKGNYLMPREHGKTTVWVVGYILWRLALWSWARTHGAQFEHDEHICVASVTQEVSDARIRQVKLELETNRYLLGDFPSLRPGRMWTANALILDGARNIVHPSLFGFGEGGAAPGWRLSCLIRDDITDPRRAGSLEYRDTVLTMSDAVLDKMLMADAVELNFQTPYDADDFPFRIAKRGITLPTNVRFDPRIHDPLSWVSRTWQALIDEESGTTLWPEVWSVDRLLRKQRENPLIFEQQMQCRPIDARKVSFPPIQYYDPTHLERRGARWYYEGELLRAYMGADPASKEKELTKGSRMAILTIGVSGPGNIYVLNARIGRFGFTEGILELENSHAGWRWEAGWLEEVNFSNAYRAVLRTRPSNLPIYGIEATGDKFQRIQATLHPLAYNKRIFLHPTDMPELVQEWTLFPGTQSLLVDGMDALEMVVRKVVSEGGASMTATGPRDRVRRRIRSVGTNIRTDYGR